MPSRSAWADYVPPEPVGTHYPKLVPMFGVRSHVPGGPCPHGVLPADTSLICMACHRTGARAEARIAAVARREKLARVNQPTDDATPRVVKFKPKGGA